MRISSLLAASALVLTLAGCGAAESTAPQEVSTPAAATVETAVPDAPTPTEVPTAAADAAPEAEPTEIVLENTEGILTMGHAFVLRAAVTPETADTALCWAASDESIATVSADGLVTAAAPGHCTITVTTADGSAAADYALTVKAAPVVQAAPAPVETTPAAQPAEPAPQEAAPAEPAQSGIVPGSVEDYDNRYKDFGTWSGIDWTKDSSCASGDGIADSYEGDYLDENPEFGYSSGIDWTKDPSCASGDDGEIDLYN